MRHFISTLFCLIIGINLLFPQLKRVEWVDNYRPVSGLSALSEDTCAFAGMWVRFDENDNLLKTYSQCFLTTDRGKSWDCIFNEIIWTQNPLGVIFTEEVIFPRKDLLLIGCDSNKIFKTTDLGETWTQQKLKVIKNSGDCKPDFKHFRKNGIGSMVLRFDIANIHVTLDRAETWDSLKVPHEGIYIIYDVVMLSDTTIISCVKSSSGINMIKTTDFGETWTTQTLNFNNVSKLFYLDDQNIWAYGGKASNEAGKYELYIQKSTNRGETWREVYTNMNENCHFVDVIFFDELNGMMSLSDVSTYRTTTDGGCTWTDIKTGIDPAKWMDLNKCDAPSQDVFYYFIEPHGLFIYDADATSVENSFSENEALLYPNPAQTGITISFEVERAGVARAEILDVFGVPVAERDLGYLDSGGQDVRLDFEEPLPPGLYWARISVGGRVIVKKFVAGR